MKKKTILFVTYGGGHARMLIPIIRELREHQDITIQTLALTTAGPIFASEGLSYKGFGDFLEPGDEEALAYGERLAATHHHDESGIARKESVAYLGLCYADLVAQHGKEGAEKKFAKEGRQSFLPLTMMQRVLTRLNPDAVVVTNSPRSERAAVEVAKTMAIPTISLVDLFGIHHFHPLESDYIFVMNEQVIDNMEREGVTIDRSGYRFVGNPAFDRAYDYRGKLDMAWRAEHFPQLSPEQKTLLWIDMPAYWHVPTRTLHQRSDNEIIRDLNDWAAACSAQGAALLIRPHPSQPRTVYDTWLESTPFTHAHYAGQLPLYPLLNAVDVVATYTSTVSVEALLMEKPLIQLQYYPGHCDMPLGEWGMAWLVRSPEEMGSALDEALHDETKIKERKAAATRYLPQEKAGKKAAELVREIVLGSQLKKSA